MDRRTFIGTAAALPIALTGQAIALTPQAATNPHVGIALDAIQEVLKEGCAYFRSPHGLICGHALKLKDPSFRIEPSDRVFYVMDGWHDEPGLNITLLEQGREIDTVTIGCMKGLNEDRKYPDYFVRTFFMDEKAEAACKPFKDQLGFDNRWLQEMKRAVASTPSQ